MPWLAAYTTAQRRSKPCYHYPRARDVAEDNEAQHESRESEEARVPHVRRHVQHLENFLSRTVQELVVKV
eukprot:780848-Amorphochlora_amoeboformis.AAC.1